MRGFYCNTFIEDMLAGKSFLDYTDLFFPNDYQPIYQSWCFPVNNVLREYNEIKEEIKYTEPSVENTM